MRKIGLALCSVLLLVGIAGAEKVTFKTEDGIEIAGEWLKPSGPQRKTFILLHGVGSSRNEWTGFAGLLSAKGYGVLAYDMRGHGESKNKDGGGTVNYQYFYGRGLQSDWGRMIGDIGSAVKFLTNKYGIEPRSICLGGASIGANLVLRYAADHEEVPVLILLSPGIDYQGILTSDVIGKIGERPVLMAACPTDGYSYQSMAALQNLVLKQRSGGVPVLTLYNEPPNAGHGVQMFRRTDPQKPSALEDKILQWIQNRTGKL